MPIKLAVDDANVTISIKGLALSHYKEERGFWETRFLRQVEGHNLTIKIKRNGVEMFSSPIDITERISITSSSAEHLPPRYEEGNDKDLSHLVNFNDPDMVGPDFEFRDVPMTILAVFNACFYCKTISSDQYTIKKNDVDVFTRRIGVITGGDIVASGQTEITFANNPGNNQTLVVEPGVVYEVIFDNDCPKPYPDTSDFDKYDDVIQTTDKFTLVGPVTPEVVAFQEDPPPDPEEKKPPCSSGQGGGTGGG